MRHLEESPKRITSSAHSRTIDQAQIEPIRSCARRRRRSSKNSSLSRGEIMIHRSFRYTIARRSKDHAGLESMFRVGVTDVISSIGTRHKNGPLRMMSWFTRPQPAIIGLFADALESKARPRSLVRTTPARARRLRPPSAQAHSRRLTERPRDRRSRHGHHR